MTGFRIKAELHVTAAQLAVLDLLAEGGRDRDIAKALSIGVGTVYNHVEALRWALGAANRAQVISRAYEKGLLPAEGRVAS